MDVIIFSSLSTDSMCSDSCLDVFLDKLLIFFVIFCIIGWSWRNLSVTVTENVSVLPEIPIMTDVQNAGGPS